MASTAAQSESLSQAKSLAPPAPRAQAAASIRWQAQPDWRDAIDEVNAIGPDAWLAIHGAEIVKTGSHRTVYSVDLPQGCVYVKRYHARSWRDRIRNLLRGAEARREWRKTLEVAGRGLPTARVVAHGTGEWLASESFLVSEAIPDTCTLTEYARDVLPSLPPRHVAAAGRRLTRTLADLLAAMHAAGVTQRDLHGGNILVQTTSNDAGGDGQAIRLYLIDLPSVRLSTPLAWPATRDNLALLSSGLRLHVTRSDLARFWRQYVRARSDLELPLTRRAGIEIAASTRTWNDRIVRRRARRCLASNRDFQRIRGPHGTAHAVRDIPRPWLARLLADPQAPLREHRHRVAKLSHSSVVVTAELPSAAGTIRAAYKRSRVKHRWKRWLFPLRRGRAMSCWRRGHALLMRGIATPRPLLASKQSGRECFLATQWIDGALDLHLYGWSLAEALPGERSRRARRCLKSLGRLVGNMHAWNVAHADLKGCNLLVVDRREETDAYLIDLDGVRIKRRLGRGTRIDNLARLAVSLQLHPWITRTMCLAFLRAYLQELTVEGDDWKSLWRDVAVEANRTLRRIRHRGRTVA